MNLILDIGNSRAKLGVFDRGRLIFQQTARSEHVARQIKEICDHYTGIRHGIIASVGQRDRTAVGVMAVYCKVHELTSQSNVPFKNSYATPKTLGVDRMALATAAFYHNPKGNTLVIDAGSCITYDIMNDYGEYLGGAISPGLRMRYRALHDYTDRLPLLTEPADTMDFIGNTTEKSMHNGVIRGLEAEIDSNIEAYGARFEDLTVILTGGDAQFLSGRLKNTIFADSNFLLKGLNHLLEYNKR